MFCQLSSLVVNINIKKSFLIPCGLHWGSLELHHCAGLFAHRQVPDYERDHSLHHKLSSGNGQDIYVTTWPHYLLDYVTPFTRLHLHCLQVWLQSVYSPSCHPVNLMLTIPAKGLSSFLMWTNLSVYLFHLFSRQNSHYWFIPTKLGSSNGQPHHTREVNTINALERWAVRKASEFFLSFIHSHYVLIMSGYTMRIFYISKQGGVKSASLCAEASQSLELVK